MMVKSEKKSPDNILVTGGHGFIGKILVKHLEKLQYSVTIVDDNRTSKRDQNEGSNSYFFDLQNRNELEDLFKEKSFEAVFHLAASAYVHESVLDPIAYYDNNLTSTICLLNAMRQANNLCPIIL